MRIWDVAPALLCQKHLTGEHRELHGLWNILTQGKRGYANHPETRRWRGKLAALYARHAALDAEMTRRSYRHASPLDPALAAGGAHQDEYVDAPAAQLCKLRARPCPCPLGEAARSRAGSAGSAGSAMSEQENNEALNRHYGRGDLAEAILDAVRAAGKNPEALTPDDLAPVDQFHIGGKPATVELAKLAGLHAGMRVLDVGGGIGGPARTLAAEFGCTVTVLDLTDEYVRTGELLTARTGLAERVQHRHGSALAMPFADASFDAAWTQHSSMNIADKERLYAEVRRVLRRGGTLALHEVMAGAAGEPRYPLPWADDAALSFLRPPAEIRSLVTAAGFRETVWQDVTAASLAFFERLQARPQPGAPPPFGLHLLLGAEAPARVANMTRGLADARLSVIEAVFRREPGIGNRE
ncbi:MAG TPA: pyrimidine dimer DNA glycosylase/endonuclease V [Dehalococcoidia bacterium]|nr:pyrimidine dimer DNA glycosylase/endonuclease V [Dehalococcoidia bacterium]